MERKARRLIKVLAAMTVLSCRHSTSNERSTPTSAPLASAPTPAEPVPSSSVAAPADAGSPVASDESKVSACNEQVPQQFLIDAHFNGRSLATAKDRSEWRASVARSIRYRTEQYGYYSGFGSYGWNTKSLTSQIHSTKFFGLYVRLHEKVIPALHCVEQAIRQQCTQFPYQPHALSGVRSKNTYFDGDVSNHVYGIAIDIDPLENPCCGCLEPWRSSPRCRGNKTDFERMDMPECWVGVFERFGFYWLGHDTLKDTMHFEFLGDPDKVKKGATSE